MSNGLDGKPVSPKDPIGYDPIPFPARTDRPPMQHSGWRPEQMSQVDAQNASFGDEVPIGFGQPKWDGEPRDDMSIPTINIGAGSLGEDIDGWHPGKDGG